METTRPLELPRIRLTPAQTTPSTALHTMAQIAESNSSRNAAHDNNSGDQENRNVSFNSGRKDHDNGHGRQRQHNQRESQPYCALRQGHSQQHSSPLNNSLRSRSSTVKSARAPGQQRQRQTSHAPTYAFWLLIQPVGQPEYQTTKNVPYGQLAETFCPTRRQRHLMEPLL